MNLTQDAMLVSLRISAWSGRLYDRQASNHVAAHHDATASAGRYNRRARTATHEPQPTSRDWGTVAELAYEVGTAVRN